MESRDERTTFLVAPHITVEQVDNSADTSQVRFESDNFLKPKDVAFPVLSKATFKHNDKPQRQKLLGDEVTLKVEEHLDESPYGMIAISQDSSKLAVTDPFLGVSVDVSEPVWPAALSERRKGSSDGSTCSLSADRREKLRQRRLDQALLHAISRRHIKDVQRYLSAGASPNATYSDSQCSACHVASISPDSDVLALLLHRGCVVNVVDVFNQTPVHWAAWAGSANCLQLLLKQKKSLVDVDSRDGQLGHSLDHEHQHTEFPVLPPGSTPLHAACQKLHVDCVKVLLKAGAKVKCADESGLTPLDTAGELVPQESNSSDLVQRFSRVVETMLGAGARPKRFWSSQDTVRTSSLHGAVRLQSVADVKALCRAGASVRLRNQAGRTALHEAAGGRLEEALKALVNEYCSAVDVLDADEESALLTATRSRWLQGVSILLEAGADVAVRTRDGATVLHLAAENGDAHMLEQLLYIDEIAQLVNARNGGGATPLHRAVQTGGADSVARLLRAGADVTATLPGGVGVLHVAARRRDAELLRLLLARDRKLRRRQVDLLDSLPTSGLGALHVAAMLGDVQSLTALLEGGGDGALRTSELPHRSATALHLAAAGNHDDALAQLLAHEPRLIQARDADGNSPLHVATSCGSRECIRRLLSEGADLAAESASGTTAVQLLIRGTSRPLQLLTEVLDSAIVINDRGIDDKDCILTVDYGVLLGGGQGGGVRVLEALLATGNIQGQHSLLLHPVVESFLSLLWGTYTRPFALIFGVFSIFVVSFTCLVATLYSPTAATSVLAEMFWRVVVAVTLVVLTFQEVVHGLQMPLAYATDWESLLKWACYATAWHSTTLGVGTTGHRSCSTIGVVLAWTELMFLLARFPNWGFYVLMFSKVAKTILKVLVTFLLLLIGFAISLTVQFEWKPPFESPWISVSKALIMMTGEYDYNDMFSGDHSSNFTGRFLLLVYVIFVAVVLMNLTIALAINNIKGLEAEGRVEKLLKQVNYIGMLEHVVNRRKKIVRVLTIYPGKPSGTLDPQLPENLRDSLIQAALLTRKGESLSIDQILREFQSLRTQLELMKSNHKSS